MFGQLRIVERRCDECGTAWLLTAEQSHFLAAGSASFAQVEDRLVRAAIQGHSGAEMLQPAIEIWPARGRAAGCARGVASLSEVPLGELHGPKGHEVGPGIAGASRTELP